MEGVEQGHLLKSGLLPLGCHLLETELKVIWQLINLIICSIDKHGRAGGWGIISCPFGAQAAMTSGTGP